MIWRSTLNRYEVAIISICGVVSGVIFDVERAMKEDMIKKKMMQYIEQEKWSKFNEGIRRINRDKDVVSPAILEAGLVARLNSDKHEEHPGIEGDVISSVSTWTHG